MAHHQSIHHCPKTWRIATTLEAVEGKDILCVKEGAAVSGEVKERMYDIKLIV